MIKYPGGRKSPKNHKHSFCSNGARSTLAISEQNKLPVQSGVAPLSSSTMALLYPLSHGIFENSTLFHPLMFIKKVTQLYEQVIINKESGNSMLQDEAFATLLMRHTITLKDGTMAFKMVDCETPKLTPDKVIIQIEGLNYLHLDCLQDTVAVGLGTWMIGTWFHYPSVLIPLTMASCCYLTTLSF